MAIVIRKAANGYIVSLDSSGEHYGTSGYNDTYVFETFDSLVQHLKKTLEPVEEKKE